jgi:hypothetical protein
MGVALRGTKGTSSLVNGILEGGVCSSYVTRGWADANRRQPPTAIESVQIRQDQSLQRPSVMSFSIEMKDHILNENDKTYILSEI